MVKCRDIQLLHLLSDAERQSQDPSHRPYSQTLSEITNDEPNSLRFRTIY